MDTLGARLKRYESFNDFSMFIRRQEYRPSSRISLQVVGQFLVADPDTCYMGRRILIHGQALGKLSRHFITSHVRGHSTT